MFFASCKNLEPGESEIRELPEQISYNFDIRL
jgi:hypothetical protein